MISSLNKLLDHYLAPDLSAARKRERQVVINEALEECGKIIDEYEAICDVLPAEDIKRRDDYKYRIEGVLRVKDKLFDLQ